MQKLTSAWHCFLLIKIQHIKQVRSMATWRTKPTICSNFRSAVSCKSSFCTSTLIQHILGVKILLRRGSNELPEMYYRTTYSFSWNFPIVELNKNNAFNLAAIYLTKTKWMLKSITFCKIIFKHRMAHLNDLTQRSEVHVLQWVEWWTKRIHTETGGRQIISQKASCVVILIFKKQ